MIPGWAIHRFEPVADARRACQSMTMQRWLFLGCLTVGVIGCQTPGPRKPPAAVAEATPSLSPASVSRPAPTPASVPEVDRATGPAGGVRTHTLVVTERWLLNPPGQERFDASALLRRKDGHLYTLTDKSAGWYRIDRLTNGTADLVRDPQWFTRAQMEALAVGKTGHWDLEGIAEGPDGCLYFCEELNRWVLRADPRSGRLERLEINWEPVRKWFSADLNSSWEGIAAGTDGRLYLANEWRLGRIVVVDLGTRQVVDDFKVSPPGRVARDNTYSDLCWYAGDLWVLCRQARHVLRVDPITHRVLADFDYTNIELSPEHGYASFIPYGQFEGLAVDAENIWLLIDNNGSARLARRDDPRPTLFRCARPDRSR